jgi:hypothetical protein
MLLLGAVRAAYLLSLLKLCTRERNDLQLGSGLLHFDEGSYFKIEPFRN